MAVWVSHFVEASPSRRFSFTSPDAASWPLAVTSTTRSITLPGTPAGGAPSTPAAFTLAGDGCGSPGSKDDQKPAPGAAASLLQAAAATAAARNARADTRLKLTMPPLLDSRGVYTRTRGRRSCQLESVPKLVMTS